MKNYYPFSYPSYVTSPSHKNFCQGHTLNSYCAKLASNSGAKVGLLTLSDPRQHKKCVFSTFIILTSLQFKFIFTRNIL